jgi:hypothetical protein
MRIIGTYVFTVFGDGRSEEYSIQLRGLQTPHPLIPGLLPTGIAEVKPPGITATLEADILHLKFDIPPSTSKVSVDALFGTDYEPTL